MNSQHKQGDPLSFDENWKTRSETHYNHYSSKSPENQIQLAFRCHFEVFSNLLEAYPTNDKKMIETGCGRGTLSNYFAVAGWDVTLLDYNESVLSVAKNIFEAQGLTVKYMKGDALALEIEDCSYDVVTNIGLLEHFEDIQTVMDEQLRILKPNGWCFSYIVPERSNNIQRYFNWLNKILKFLTIRWTPQPPPQKPEIYRSDNYSDRYLNCIDCERVKNIVCHGMYPLPMISHSPEFPFSLLPKPLELILTYLFKFILITRRAMFQRHGWICDEKLGQAFLVAFQKK